MESMNEYYVPVETALPLDSELILSQDHDSHKSQPCDSRRHYLHAQHRIERAFRSRVFGKFAIAFHKSTLTLDNAKRRRETRSFREEGSRPEGAPSLNLSCMLAADTFREPSFQLVVRDRCAMLSNPIYQHRPCETRQAATLSPIIPPCQAEVERSDDTPRLDARRTDRLVRDATQRTDNRVEKTPREHWRGDGGLLVP